MSNVEALYILSTFAIVFAAIGIAFLVTKRLMKRSNPFLRLGVGIIIVAASFLAAILGPIHSARVIGDTELLMHPPFQVGYPKGINPESDEVFIAVTNALGKFGYLDINRSTRQITFSGVEVPDEIGL